ncbi:hypothetical protein Golax_016321 [Gossypium laxum]|uniref:Transmembrane protein n=11 Tax=Gossypium TaxID=3633 RepID=A0A7J8YWX3_9ROSI|nr:hypothetical protein [Gossypium laxum]
MSRWPQLLRALTWTVVLTLMVSIASFVPEMAFVSAVSPSSSFSRSCNSEGFVRIPLDFPREKLCLPAHTVKRSKIDFFVPTIFAALVVAASACVVRSLGLWETETGPPVLTFPASGADILYTPLACWTRGSRSFLRTQFATPSYKVCPRTLLASYLGEHASSELGPSGSRVGDPNPFRKFRLAITGQVSSSIVIDELT